MRNMSPIRNRAPCGRECNIHSHGALKFIQVELDKNANKEGNVQFLNSILKIKQNPKIILKFIGKIYCFG